MLSVTGSAPVIPMFPPHFYYFETNSLLMLNSWLMSSWIQTHVQKSKCKGEFQIYYEGRMTWNANSRTKRRGRMDTISMDLRSQAVFIYRRGVQFLCRFHGDHAEVPGGRRASMSVIQGTRESYGLRSCGCLFRVIFDSSDDTAHRPKLQYFSSQIQTKLK